MSTDDEGRHYGCYKDEASKRDLDAHRTVFAADNSPQKCLNHCLRLASRYRYRYRIASKGFTENDRKMIIPFSLSKQRRLRLCGSPIRDRVSLRSDVRSIRTASRHRLRSSLSRGQRRRRGRRRRRHQRRQMRGFFDAEHLRDGFGSEGGKQSRSRRSRQIHVGPIQRCQNCLRSDAQRARR